MNARPRCITQLIRCFDELRTESAVVSFGFYDRESGRRAPELWDWFHFTVRGTVHMVPYDEEERLYECILLV